MMSLPQSSLQSQQPRFGELSYVWGREKVPPKYNDQGLKEGGNNLLQVNIMATGEDVQDYFHVLKIENAARHKDEENPFEVGHATLLFALQEGGDVSVWKEGKAPEQITDIMKQMYHKMLTQLGVGEAIGPRDEKTLNQCLDIIQNVETSVSKVNASATG